MKEDCSGEIRHKIEVQLVYLEVVFHFCFIWVSNS